jgi:hypothetical protein
MFRTILSLSVAMLLGAYFLAPSHEVVGADQNEISQEPTVYDEHLLEKQSRLAVRMAYKEALITGLLDGDFHLQQVAKEFLTLNKEDSISLDMMLHLYPGQNDEEKTALNVIDYVNARPLSTCDKEAVLANLRAEHERLYRGK